MSFFVVTYFRFSLGQVNCPKPKVFATGENAWTAAFAAAARRAGLPFVVAVPFIDAEQKGHGYAVSFFVVTYFHFSLGQVNCPKPKVFTKGENACTAQKRRRLAGPGIRDRCWTSPPDGRRLGDVGGKIHRIFIHPGQDLVYWSIS